MEAKKKKRLESEVTQYSAAENITKGTFMVSEDTSVAHSRSTKIMSNQNQYNAPSTAQMIEGKCWLILNKINFNGDISRTEVKLIL